MTDNTISTSITTELPSYSLFDLGIADDEFTINQTVGDENGQDIYAFSVTETGKFNLSLEGLTADADLLLLDENIEQVAISQAYENESESITAELTPGEYYATVFSYDNVETDYSFGISNTSIAEEIPDPEPEKPNTSGDDVLHGNYFNDTLEGGAGNDSLYGEGGSDELLGGAGDDFLSGSSGTSNYWGGISWIDPYPFLPTDPYENWWDDSWEFDSSLYLDSEEIESISTNVFSATATTDISTDSFTDYDWANPYGGLWDEVDTLTGGEGADTFALGDSLGIYYEDSYISIDTFSPEFYIPHIENNNYAIITDFNSQEGDVFQVYGNLEDYTLSTENFTGTELADTLIHYGSDLVAVVRDNVDVSLEQDFTALGSTPDFTQYFTDYLTT